MNEPKSKTLNTTRSIAVLIHLKSLGIIHNTYSDFKFNPERAQRPNAKDEYFKIAYLNGVKDRIEIEAPIANEHLLVDALLLKVNGRAIVLNNIRLDFKGIKDFKELRIIERVRVAGKSDNFRELLNEFLLTEWLSYKAQIKRQKFIDEAVLPYQEQIKELTDKIDSLNGELANCGKERSELVTKLQQSYEEATSLQAASVAQSQQIDGLEKELTHDEALIKNMERSAQEHIFPKLPLLLEVAKKEGMKTLTFNMTVSVQQNTVNGADAWLSTIPAIDVVTESLIKQ